jgi:uncharacterized SAM-binding protein YcdF (DUF218 family)
MALTFPYVLKRGISQFLMPVPLVIELFALGWALHRFSRFKRTGRACQALAGCLFIAFAMGAGSSYLYRHERQYAPFDANASRAQDLRGADIAVLGQTFAEESDLPLRCRATATMLLRLQEGVRVARLVPESRLLVSVAGPAPEREKTAFLDEYAALSGIERTRFVLLTGALDTAGEARLVREKAGADRPLILATSAAHMPRAMGIFRKAGMAPIPAPCDYQQVSDRRRWRWIALPLPSGDGFRTAEGAIYEWLGTLYERIRNSR